MGRTAAVIDERAAAFVVAQPVFFVATAPLAPDGHVNCSPKGNRGELVVLDEQRVAYLDQTGSGIETVAHLRENGRMVLMTCAFDGPPRIVRLHGRGEVVVSGDPRFSALRDRFTGGVPGHPAGARAGAGPADVRDPPDSRDPGSARDRAESRDPADSWDSGSVRAVVLLTVDRVSDSCGFGVPVMAFQGHRPQLGDWARRKGQAGLVEYRTEHNAQSIDGIAGL